MIEKFENVTAVAKANVYFDGKVISHTIFLPNGDRKTLGIFMPGDYEFGTGDAEIMDMTDGIAEVLLPGETMWKKFKEGEAFNIPANSKFRLKCADIVQYVCSYIK
ncbi:pyrimidine/purine nucleoside phosphorylase [Synergistaceae bacterium OttesenSCG-928-D05]|nr:pyrimidine/purine nucleoside phosphorylase [Synergistaceae bacterium OttesenSCG-928-D05]